MARMTTAKLNELLAKAVAGLQGDAMTMIELDENPFKPYLPESYWAEREAARVKTAELFNRSVDIVRERMIRQSKDDKLAAVSAADIMAEWDDQLPRLQGTSTKLHDAGWGRDTMKTAWGGRTVHKATVFQPRYDYECALCGLPITNTTGDWLDHRGKRKCDQALVTWNLSEEDWEWHMPKPIDGEELDE